MGHKLLVLLLFLLAFPSCLQALCPPPPSVQCESNGGGCQIFNAKGIWEDRSICRAAEAVSPKTEAEILHAVARAVEKKQKIKVVSTLAHSISKLVCVEEHGLIISTENYASVIGVNKGAMTITVQGGAMMRDVMEEAAKEGLALPAMAYWNGVSAAGVVSTGAHGSGLEGRGSGVYEYVVGMKLVVPASPSEGYSKVMSLSTETDEDELKAARLSLGTLGVISQVTFALQPMFKRSLSRPILSDDKELQNEAAHFLRAHDLSDLYWFPFHQKALFRRFDRVSVEVPGDGLNVAIGHFPSSVAIIEYSDHLNGIIQSTEDSARMCSLIGEEINELTFNGSGFWNDEIKGFTGYPVIGFNHRMQSSGGCQGTYNNNNHNHTGCTPNKILDKNETVCAWDRRVPAAFDFNVGLTVPISRLPEAIIDIKKLRDLNPPSMCEVYVFFRSIKKSDAYLGPAEDTVTLEVTYYRPREAKTPKWNEDVYEEIEQMVIEKHSGSLHWGKDGGYLFGGLAKRTVNLEKFLQVKNRYDPEGVFSSEWTDGLFGIGGQGLEQLRDGCALDKMCKCREDKHCDPEKGYFCRPGRIWKKARVCRQLN
eukprot:PITA_11821